MEKEKPKGEDNFVFETSEDIEVVQDFDQLKLKEDLLKGKCALEGQILHTVFCLRRHLFVRF